MKFLVPIRKSLPIEHIIPKWRSVVLSTKWNRSYTINVLATQEHVDKVRVIDIEDQATTIVKLLKLLLPKRLFFEVHKQIAREVSKGIWDKKKKRRERYQKEKSAKEEAMKPDDIKVQVWREEEEDYIHRWGDDHDVPDDFEVPVETEK
jgi:hypothetical protein